MASVETTEATLGARRASGSEITRKYTSVTSGVCTNTVGGGFGPQHTPSGRDCIIDQSLGSFSLLSAPVCSSPTCTGDVFVDGELCEPLETLDEAGTSEISSIMDPIHSPSFLDGDQYTWLNVGSVVLDGDEIPYSSILAEGQEDSAVLRRLCREGAGPCKHELDGVPIQLNPCAFYDECYRHSAGQDLNADYIYSGVSKGFKIVDNSFSGSYFCTNYDSILDPEFKSQMDNTIASELVEGKVSIVSDRPQCVHALGAIRKSNGKLRPITDCRRPEGLSINNSMSTTAKEFTFMKLDQVAEYMSQDCWFAVLDLKAAYRSVHIYPLHRKFQGFMWEVNGVSEYLTDNCLSFGLKCAPFIFSRLTEFVLRGMERRGHPGIFGYLDDFLVVADSALECREKLQSLIAFLRYLGFAIAWDKVVSPTQVVTYLGIEIDSTKMQFRLPEKKVLRVKAMVTHYQNATKATKRELQVLAGHLAHASTVVRGGRTFSRRLLNLVKYLPDSPRSVPLPTWFRPDLVWWSQLMSVFNGAAHIIRSQTTLEGHVATDSSMSGFGGVWSGDWFVGTWHDDPSEDSRVPDHHVEKPPSGFRDDMNINILELWPIVVSAHRWGKCWYGKKVLFLTDNTQVLQMINTGRSSSVECMFWIRELFWLSFIHNFQAVASHIGTRENIVPDYLSRCYDAKNIARIPKSLTDHLCCFQSWPLCTHL